MVAQMPRKGKEKMARKSAAGTGTIRKKTITRNDKVYTYWEARYTEGRDNGTGKQIQRSITGKTQKEVAQKLKVATATIDDGTYIEPCKMTVAQWLNIWTAEYLGGVKPSTVSAYKTTVKTHLIPGLGAIRMDALNTHTVQGLYNHLFDTKGLSAKTVKNVHGVLHKALQQAVANNYIRMNPTEPCILPRSVRKEINPLSEDQISAFLTAIQGHELQDLFTVTLFTGLRQGEALGLQWKYIDLNNGTMLIKQQLQLMKGTGGKYQLIQTKNSKGRSITLPPTVINILNRIYLKQAQNKRHFWDEYDDNDFVFTDELGHHLHISTVYKSFKRVMDQIGSPKTRFHDLRHSYAVAAIKSGDDIKTVQENLGHATASFTLDIYGHVTERMKQDSANRMEQFINSVKA